MTRQRGDAELGIDIDSRPDVAVEMACRIELDP